MNDKKGYAYFDIPKQERDSAIGFLLNALLQARASCQRPSNQKIFDEDVNIYLAHLLFANSLPDYQEMTNRYLSLNSSDLMELVDHNPDKVVRYFIYKVNADYLLVHLGIFSDLCASVRRPFKKSERQYAEMAQNYYDHALICNQQIYRKKTAIGDVLEKLSLNFSDYQVILHSVRKEFFQMMNWIRSREISPGSQDKQAAPFRPPQGWIEEKQNEFLDLYGEWLKTKSEELVPQLIHLVEEIKLADPTFGFDIDSVRGADARR